MKKSIICIALSTIAMASCNKEESSGLENSGNPVWREFAAVIRDGVSTKVSFGTPDGDKIPARFQTGDEIALTDAVGNIQKATVTKTEGESCIMGGNMPENFVPTAAYYPYAAYNDGKLVVPAVQTYGSVPVLLKSTSIADNLISFSADAGSAVIRFSLTGNILVKEIGLHTAAMSEGDAPEYTIAFPEGTRLGKDPLAVCFAVEAGEAVLTVEVKTEKPDGSPFSYYKSKTTPVNLASGAFVEMSAIELLSDGMTGNYIFGDWGGDSEAEDIEGTSPTVDTDNSFGDWDEREDEDITGTAAAE